MRRITVFILVIFISADFFDLTEAFGKSTTNSSRPPPLKLPTPTVRNLIIDGVKDILDKTQDDHGQIIQKLAELVKQIRTTSITRDIHKQERAISKPTSPMETLARVQAIEDMQQNLEKIEQGHGVLHSQLGQRLNETLGNAVKEWLEKNSDSAKQNVVDIVLKTITEDLEAFIRQKMMEIDRLHQQSDKFIDDVKTIMSDETDRKLKMSSVKEIVHQRREVEQKQFGDKLMLKIAERVLVDVAGKPYCGGICDDLIINTCDST